MINVGPTFIPEFRVEVTSTLYIFFDFFLFIKVLKSPASGKENVRFSACPDFENFPYLTKSWACASCCCKWWCSGGGGEGFLSSAVNRDGNTSDSLVAEVVEAVMPVWLPVPLTETDVAEQCCPPPSPDLIVCCSCKLT